MLVFSVGKKNGKKHMVQEKYLLTMGVQQYTDKQRRWVKDSVHNTRRVVWTDGNVL